MCVRGRRNCGGVSAALFAFKTLLVWLSNVFQFCCSRPESITIRVLLLLPSGTQKSPFFALVWLFAYHWKYDLAQGAFRVAAQICWREPWPLNVRLISDKFMANRLQLAFEYKLINESDFHFHPVRLWGHSTFAWVCSGELHMSADWCVSSWASPCRLTGSVVMSWLGLIC